MIGVSISPFSSLLPIPTSKGRPYPPSPYPLLPQTLYPKPRKNTGHLLCMSTSTGKPGPASSGENENKVVLDAFFLGKAFAEALNERIGSAAGEILSVVGQLQAKQQKQVQVFQEEVLERAKRSKEKAALEAMEDKGLVSKSSAAPRDPANGVRRPSSGPTAEDPLQEMLKD
ncbi:uncharacterized protein M6B38_157705 [Iris pallida]|uniref:Uncharacterized protein n=1 Tax=Iris pallida TaxID=29817 RepID=A0AAX6F1R6_IRIPA|nr:uncharacterized protein M6B38_157705 [Iris pallida]